MVAVGEAIVVDPVVIDNPDEGLQTYVSAPLAVNVTLPPLQKAEGLEGEMVTVGSGFTVIDLVTVVVQPFPFVTE